MKRELYERLRSSAYETLKSSGIVEPITQLPREVLEQFVVFAIRSPEGKIVEVEPTRDETVPDETISVRFLFYNHLPRFDQRFEIV